MVEELDFAREISHVHNYSDRNGTEGRIAVAKGLNNSTELGELWSGVRVGDAKE